MVMVPLVQTWSVRCPDENAFLEQDGETWIRGAGKGIGLFTRAKALELSINVQWPHGRRTIYVQPEPACACCGKTSFQEKLWRVTPPGVAPAQFRCDRHRDRNPCAVDGCGRTRASKQPSFDAFLCSRHWRQVPKAMKLVHSRIWRLARKSEGWTDKLVYRERRIWARIVNFAQTRAAGGEMLDLAAIEREFGL